MIQFRKVDPLEKVWVNVGDGNITSVVDVSLNLVGHDPRPRALINFIGGGQIEVFGSSGRDVVDRLTDSRGI